MKWCSLKFLRLCIINDPGLFHAIENESLHLLVIFCTNGTGFEFPRKKGKEVKQIYCESIMKILTRNSKQLFCR